MAISAKFYVSVNGGANQSGGIEVPSGASVALVPVSIAGWLRARWEIYDYPEGWTAPIGWLTDPNTGTIYSLDIIPPSFTLPLNAIRWGKWMLRCLVNEQIDDDQNRLGDLIDDANALSMLSPHGLVDVGARELEHFTTATTRVKGWARSIQRTLRAIELYAVLGVGPTITNSNVGSLNDIPSTQSGADADVIVLIGGSLKTLTGIASPSASRRLVVINGGVGSLAIVNGSASSSVGQRITTPTSQTITVLPGRSVEFLYSTSSNSWLLLGSISDFGSQDVKLTGALAHGSIVADAGDHRVKSGWSLKGRNGTNSANVDVLELNGSNDVYVGNQTNAPNARLWGSSTSGLAVGGNTDYAIVTAGAGLSVFAASAERFNVGASLITSALPRVGNSSPYASEGRATQAMADANQTLAAAIYSRKQVRLTGTHTAVRTATFPHPASENASYTKHLDNQCTGFNTIISTGTGTTFVMAPGQGLALDFTPSGVRLALADGDPDVMGFRLSVSSGVSVPFADNANVSTIYLTPHVSGAIALFDGSSWVRRVTPEISLALSGLTAGKNYDVFASWSGSAVVLTLGTAWTSDTLRASLLGTQNGVYVQSGDATKRYVGTIRATSATQTQDTAAQRFVWNMYNRIERALYIEDTTASWTYSVATWRQARATASNRVEIVCGQVLPINARVFSMQMGLPAGTGVAMMVGIGVDSTNTNSAKGVAMLPFVTTSPQWNPALAECDAVLSAGYHAINWLEIGHASTCTAYGTVNNQQSHLRARAMM